MATHQIAQSIAKMGRNGDSMLVHMQPREVAGLQALAQQHGTSLTINPHTGMPEAFSLGGLFKAIAPIAAGAFLGPGGAAIFDSALTAGLAVGAGAFALTGDPMQAVSAGLGGYGGANLGANLSAYGKVAGPESVAGPAVTGANLSSSVPGTTGVGAFTEGAGTAGLSSTGSMASTVPYSGYVGQAGTSTAGIGADMSFKPTNLVSSTGATAVPKTPFTGGVQSASGLDNMSSGVKRIFGTAPPAGSTYATGTGTGFSGYSDFAKQGYYDAAGNLVKPSLTQDALTVGMPIAMEAMRVEPLKAPTSVGKEFNYKGPYTAQDRNTRMPTIEEQRAIAAAGSPEYAYYGNSNPYPGFNVAPGYADGGSINSDNSPPPVLSQDGYGLGRLNAMANSGTSYAGGGAIAFDNGGAIPTIGGPETAYRMSDAAGANYAVAPTDLAKVAEAGSVKDTAAQESSLPGLGGILGIQRQAANATTDPMGRITGTGINQLNRGFGSVYNGVFGPLHRLMQQSAPTQQTAPRALTMQDYIDTARRQYNPNATLETINTPGAPELAQMTNINPQAPQLKAAGGGIHALRSGGKTQPGGYLDGKGDGMSDSIPATIEGKQPARLADGEFVIPADVVSHLGNGSSKAGAKHLYKMMDKVRKARTGKVSQGKQINPNKYLSA